MIRGFFQILAGIIAMSALAPPALAAQPLPPALEGRCGTFTRAAGPSGAAVAAVRPNYPNQLFSSHFLVHYPAGADTTYVRGVSEAAELAWRVLVDTLGYDAPPSDGVAGGDGRTDLYVRPVAEIGSVFGVTYPETWKAVPYPNSWTSWAEVVDTMSTGRMQTVTAHEFFHVIQLGYQKDPVAGAYVSFLEMASTWVEERVFDDNNIYLEVLPFFFDEPHKNLFGYTYSNVPWMIYLTERYGDAVLRDILTECALAGLAGANPVTAHNTVLPLYGAGPMVDETTTFTLWNYFTGGRDDGSHYEEGATWPEVTVEKRSTCMPFEPYTTTHRYGTYGSNYYFFDGNYQKDTLRVEIVLAYWNTTTATVTRFQPGARLTERVTFPQFVANGAIAIDDWRDCDSLLVVMNNDGGAQSTSDTGISAHFPRSASPVRSHVLLLDRDGCRRPFDGTGDEFTTREGEEQPWALAMAAQSLPFVQTDSIPDDLSLCIGVVVVGGADGGGILLSDGELGELMGYMDGGGHVYLESRRFGEWADPGQGTPTMEQSRFWSYFGCDFNPGNPTGNVSAWQTAAGTALGGHGFDYDFQGASDAFVGRLVPTVADTLATDTSGDVRMTIYTGGPGSMRIYSTLVLGASTGAGASSREQFVQALVDLWGPLTPALSLVRMTVRVEGTRVEFSGELSGYANETLVMRRSGGSVVVDVPVTIEIAGAALVRANDDPGPGRFDYQLVRLEADGSDGTMLWQQSVVTGAGTRPLALTSVAPNPVRGPVRITLESDRQRSLSVAIYDVAGRRVWAGREQVGAGVSTLTVTGPSGLPSGVYFLRVSDGALGVGRKLLILR